MGILLAALLTTVLGAGEAPPPSAAPPTGTLTRPPELLQFVPAEYPPEAAAAGIEGTVVLSIVIDARGEIAQAVVTDPGPHPSFAAAALHAVQQFRFRPAEIDGKPAAVEIEYRYQFVLRKPEPPPKVEAPVVLTGRVVERGTRSPVAGATVEAEGASAETGADGRFTLRGPPGEVVVRVSSPEHEPFATRETLQDGHPRDVEYRLTRHRYDPYEAVVRGEQRPRDVTVRTLETEEVRTVPGTQGDVLKVLQDLPGVARAPFGIGLLVVRGAEPTQTPVYVDGILVPQLFHFLALTSVVNGDVVRSLDFYPGNFGVRWGRATGGTVELDTREPRRAWHGAAQVDVWDGRLEVEGPVGSGSAYASIRRSWIDAVLAVALPRVAPRSANDLRVAPRYYDYQTKLAFPLLGGQGSVFAFGSDDLLTFVRAQDQPGRPSFHLSTVFHRVGASWRRPLGALTNDLVLAVGRDTTDVNRGDVFGVASTMTSFTLRDALAWRLSDAWTLELGTDLYLRRLAYDVYASPPGTPGAIADPTQDSPSTVAESELGWWLSPAVYGEASWRATARLRLVGGLRADGERRFARSRAWLDPRLAAFYDLRPGTTLSAGAGLFGSPSQPQQTSPTFGNPALRPERALHLSLGVKQELPYRSSLELTGYYKWMWDLVVRTADLDPGTQQPLRYSNAGRGRAWGSELLLRRELARGLFGWLSWSWSRSERINDPSVTPHGWRLFVLDQTHVLAVVASYRLPREWIAGARVRFVSGNPYTPFAGSVLNADTGSFVCLPGAPLARRLPPFFQADARVDKRWVYDRWMFSAYVDVQNVSNRQNEEARFRNYDCSDTVPVPSIPLFPAIGLRAEW